jgi:hypothetical protein
MTMRFFISRKLILVRLIIVFVLTSLAGLNTSEVFATTYNMTAFWHRNTTTTCPSTGLFGAYNWNEGSGGTTDDKSTQNNDLTFFNHTWTASGHTGSTLVWTEASNTWALKSAPAGATLTNGATAMAWVYPTSDPGSGEHLIVSLNHGGSGDWPFGIEAFDYAQATGQPTCWRESGGGYLQPGVASKITLNTWTHIACTYDKSNIKIYINGTLVKTQAATGTVDAGDPYIQIGQDSSSGEIFSGRIDDVRLYSNKALTAAEITACMNTPVN